MDRGVWQAPVHGVIRVRHNLVTKPPPPALRTQRFHYQGSGSTAGWGTKIPQASTARKKKKNHSWEDTKISTSTQQEFERS